MKRNRSIVLSAAALVAFLASTLGIRLAARETGPSEAPPPPRLARHAGAAPAAVVPAPKALGALQVPCWGCPAPQGEAWPVRFQTDLDLLAPLGNGTENAALWLKDFARKLGAREDEAEKALKGRVDGPGDLGKVLPPDDGLLLEAEPWADQATMRFYPDVFALDGIRTPIPNLAISLAFAKSWVARALQHPEDASALEDCRRAIRWGRLLRQEDTTLIQDLVGLACIRVGAQGLYDLASRRGDADLRLASAVALGEHAPQRLRTAQMVTRLSATRGCAGEEIRDEKVKTILGEAKGALDRRFRLEAILQLAVVRTLGARAQRASVEEALGQLAASQDPIVSSMATWALKTQLDEKGIAALQAND